LEAVGYLGTLSSFRGAGTVDLVRDGASRAVLRGEFEMAGRRLLVETELRPAAGRNRTQVNRQPLRRAAELQEQVPVLTFQPDDLLVVKGSPGARRDAIDGAIVSLWPRTAEDRRRLAACLRQRNALLRRIRAGQARPGELEFWDARLAPLADRIVRRRQAFAEALQPLLAAEYAQITDDPTLTLGYAATATGADPSDFVKALRQARSADIERGATGVGPHRDDLVLHLRAHPLASFGSRGQLRLAGVALKLAQFELAQRRTGERPVLLLDDVTAELDPHHRRLLLERLAPAAQTIITTADPLGLDAPMLGDVTWLLVEGGRIRATNAPA